MALQGPQGQRCEQEVGLTGGLARAHVPGQHLGFSSTVFPQPCWNNEACWCGGPGPCPAVHAELPVLPSRPARLTEHCQRSSAPSCVSKCERGWEASRSPRRGRWVSWAGRRCLVRTVRGCLCGGS